MVREIKFRAKYFDEWYFGIIVTRKVKDKGRMRNIYILMGLDNENWIPLREDQYDTIGQFTGLYDKNGKEIYEGDIVLWERKKVHIEGRPLQDFSDVCKIYYDDQLHAFRYRYKMTCGSASGLLTFNDDRAEASYIEVIGNIYDNPELLKENKV